MPPPFVTTFGTRWRSKVPARPVCTSGSGEFSFSPRRSPECEVNGFAYETITNHSTIKIVEILRVARFTKITRYLMWKKYINVKSRHCSFDNDVLIDSSQC